jgi:hypothetical protein
MMNGITRHITRFMAASSSLPLSTVLAVLIACPSAEIALSGK